MKTVQVVDVAKTIVEQEILGLERLKTCIDEDFEHVIDLILKIKGKVIIGGMGKSGHVANKIAATMSSLGTPSFAIHPGEASHGDLGVITQHDLVILLSNSGETKELSDIIYYCEINNIPLIGIATNAESTLVQKSKQALCIPKIDEASKVNAPTTSTTMMMVLGDALAVTLAEIKSFSKQNFSNFHPGGSLGASFVKSDKIMRVAEQIPIVYPSMLMADAIMIITEKSLGCAIVLNNDAKVIGIITDGDLRRNMGSDLLNRKCEDIMSSDPYCIGEDEYVAEAVLVMNKRNVTNLCVTHLDKLVGVLHLHDCLRAK